jgi:hypothetical protein
MPDLPTEPPYWKCEKPLIDHALQVLAPADFKIVFAVERKTTGHFSREDAELSVDLLSEITGLHRNVVARSRRRLIEWGVLVEISHWNNRRGARLKVNRDTSSWCHLSGDTSAVIQGHLSGDTSITAEGIQGHLSGASSVTGAVPRVSPERCPQKKILEAPCEELLRDPSNGRAPGDDPEGSPGDGREEEIAPEGMPQAIRIIYENGLAKLRAEREAS